MWRQLPTASPHGAADRCPGMLDSPTLDQCHECCTRSGCQAQAELESSCCLAVDHQPSPTQTVARILRAKGVSSEWQVNGVKVPKRSASVSLAMLARGSSVRAGAGQQEQLEQQRQLSHDPDWDGIQRWWQIQPANIGAAAGPPAAAASAATLRRLQRSAGSRLMTGGGERGARVSKARSHQALSALQAAAAADAVGRWQGGWWLLPVKACSAAELMAGSSGHGAAAAATSCAACRRALQATQPGVATVPAAPGRQHLSGGLQNDRPWPASAARGPTCTAACRRRGF